jgi:hypothetical protein
VDGRRVAPDAGDGPHVDAREKKGVLETNGLVYDPGAVGAAQERLALFQDGLQ